jgi:hopanoid biosynthesis associated protein HpnK
MRQLIVNADDFGLTEAVSRGILDAHKEGIVTSTTLMANGGAFDAAVSMSRQAPRLGIGVHLNLTAGEPASPALSIPSLVDRSGRLHLSPGRLLRALVTRQVNLAEVESELRRQITKVLSTGILLTHLDGHKHVHVLPGISDVVIRLAQEFSIRSIRCPWELAPNLQTLPWSGNSRTAVVKQYLVGRLVSGFARGFKEKLAKAELLFPTHFYGLSQTGFLHAKGIQEIVERLSDGVSGLMCHPGYLDTDLVRAGTRLLTQRDVEMRAVTAPLVRKLVADRGIQLISYRQLGTYAEARDNAARKFTIGSEQIRCGPLQQGSLYDE